MNDDQRIRQVAIVRLRLQTAPTMPTTYPAVCFFDFEFEMSVFVRLNAKYKEIEWLLPMHCEVVDRIEQLAAKHHDLHQMAIFPDFSKKTKTNINNNYSDLL